MQSATTGLVAIVILVLGLAYGVWNAAHPWHDPPGTYRPGVADGTQDWR